MQKVSLKKARECLGKLVDNVRHGETVIITRHGKDIVKLENISSDTRRKKTLPDLSEFRNSLNIKGPNLTEIVLKRRRLERY